MQNPFELLERRLARIEQLLAALATEAPPEQPEADLLNIKQAADLLNLARATVYNLVSKKELPHFKKGKRLYFSKAALLNWIKEGKKPTLAEIQDQVSETLDQLKS